MYSSTERSTSLGTIPGVEHEGEHHLGAYGVEPVLEGGDDAEVAPPTADGPEQVRVLLLAGRQRTAVGGNHSTEMRLSDERPCLRLS